MDIKVFGEMPIHPPTHLFIPGRLLKLEKYNAMRATEQKLMQRGAVFFSKRTQG